MRRRTVLASIPPLLAGCFGAIDGDGSTTTRSTPVTTEVAPTTARTTTTTTYDTTEPATETASTTEQPYELLPAEPASMTVDEVRARIADRDCSELTDLPTTCPGDDARLDVSLSPAVGALSEEAVEISIENQADEPFKWGAADWQLQKWDGNGWRHIAPLSVPAVLNRIPPGDSHTYRITTGESDPVDGQRAYIAEEKISIGGLGPGIYGFSTDGYFESAPDDEFAVAAVFGFAGEGPPVRHTYIDPLVKRNESELLVRSIQPERKPDTLFISLVDGEPDARLLAEHIHQLRPLLNALPYAATDGIETIRYEGNADDVAFVDTYLSAVTPDGASRFEFRDLVFELSGTG